MEVLNKDELWAEIEGKYGSNVMFKKLAQIRCIFLDGYDILVVRTTLFDVIILQGLPPDVYAIVNYHNVSKEIRDRVKLLMHDTKLSLQEKECKLYDEFDKFLVVKGETLYHYYWRFAQLINNRNDINMSMTPVQVNMKFLNSLLPEWSKFVTDVKLARCLHTTKLDQLYSYLKQHEAYANETRLLRERYEDPHVVLFWFISGDDQLHSIASLNKAMVFLVVVTALKFPSTNNQLRISFNPRNQATIQDDKFWGNNTGGQARVVKCYNFQGIPDGQAAQTTIPNTTAFQTEDLDAYDSDYDDVSNAKAVLMANLSNYGSYVILEIAQQIKPTLYDGIVISSQHTPSHVIDDEETLILEEVSRYKMLAKQKDPMSKDKTVNTTPINYVELNRLSEDFGKCFIRQQELHAEQVFWLQASHPNTDRSASSPVKIEAPKELPKLTMQLNQEIFQKDTSSDNQYALKIPEYFENNDLKAQLQAKDTTIYKLKEYIKSMKENTKKENVKQEMDEIEIINIKLEHKQCDSLIAQLNSKSMENADLKGQIQEKVFVTTTLQNELRRLKVEQAKVKQPLDNALDFACKHAKRIEELLVYVQDTGPTANKPRLKSSTSASRSQPKGNKKNDKILQIPSSNMKSKVEDHPRRVKSKSNKKNRVKDPICDANVKHTMLNANFELICVKCKQCSSKRAKIVESKIVSNSKPNNSWRSNATDVPFSSSFVSDSKFLGTVRFGNNQIAKIMGYGDYQLGNVIISRVYYVEGLGHNLFSVGQFCDADLEVTFQKNTCFIRNLEGVDLLLGSRDTNLYTISLDDMLKTSPIYLLSKALKTKSWLGHRRLSHLNFGTLNKLAKDGLIRGIAELKFKKDHVCQHVH
ncbi:retrovirus-related pol polyprotein from transposon TNT 1-94 [Tanacetum coccineum]